jgi:2-iminobutanoate/2-iminopropanoate deaminase
MAEPPAPPADRAWAIDSWTFTDGVPAPVAPYAHATAAGPLVFVTGQLPIHPDTDEVIGADDVVAQTDQVMRNLDVVLQRTGSSLDRMLMVRAYLTSMDLYDDFNRAYAAWFPGRLPSRTCVSIGGLARGCWVEIDVIALRA